MAMRWENLYSSLSASAVSYFMPSELFVFLSLISCIAQGCETRLDMFLIIVLSSPFQNDMHSMICLQNDVM